MSQQSIDEVTINDHSSDDEETISEANSELLKKRLDELQINHQQLIKENQSLKEKKHRLRKKCEIQAQKIKNYEMIINQIGTDEGEEKNHVIELQKIISEAENEHEILCNLVNKLEELNERRSQFREKLKPSFHSQFNIDEDNQETVNLENSNVTNTDQINCRPNYIPMMNELNKDVMEIVDSTLSYQEECNQLLDDYRKYYQNLLKANNQQLEQSEENAKEPQFESELSTQE